MANREIIIEIPEDKYDRLIQQMRLDRNFSACKISLLPKGHGRLIAEPTEEEIAKTIGGKNDFADCIRDSVKAVFGNAPTIIEADEGKTFDC